MTYLNLNTMLDGKELLKDNIDGIKKLQAN